MSGLGKLYRGDLDFDFVGLRKRWYAIIAVILLICVGSMLIRGFNLGIDFSGGTQFQAPVAKGVSEGEVSRVVEDAGVDVASAQTVGTGDAATYLIKAASLNSEKREEVAADLAKAVNVQPDEITVNKVSPSWGNQVTNQALIALVVFLVLVSVYLWIRFEQKAAISALAALAFDLTSTAGVYSLVGFEITPSMVIGMLTILGYSLYDTVVIFDKVHENTRGILSSSRQTYGEAANLAVNQTLMRSINTTLVSVLPVVALLVVGVWLLGAGTLKDLALVLTIGMVSGGFSSIFLATPLLVELKKLEPRYRSQEKRVLAKRAGEDTSGKAARRQAKRAEAAKAKRRQVDDDDEYDDTDQVDEAEDLAEEPEAADADDDADDRELAGSAPRPGSRPGGKGARKKAGSKSTRGGKRKR
ncbi:MAG: protein translocase subunit SecF [Micromonosporaceae bacterium]